MQPDRFAFRTMLMGTTSPVALWSNVDPAPATMDNLPVSLAAVRRERNPEMRQRDMSRMVTVITGTPEGITRTERMSLGEQRERQAADRDRKGLPAWPSIEP